MTGLSSSHMPSPRVRKTIAQALWLMDLCFLVLLAGTAFLARIDLTEAPAFALVLVALAGLWAIHAIDAYRHRDELSRAPELHRQRERRGF